MKGPLTTFMRLQRHRSLQGHYDIKTGSSRTLNPDITGPDATTNNVHEPYSAHSGIYRESMSKAPGWPGHGIQHGLEPEERLSALPMLFLPFICVFSPYLNIINKFSSSC